MQHINTKQVLQQIRADLIGKDSYRGVTLTYTWLANQFGHFSLGFIPSFLVYRLLQNVEGIAYASVWAAAIVSTAWLLFELYNFLGPLVLEKDNKLKEAYTFQPAWVNVAYDTFTDVCFFTLGAFAFSSIVSNHSLCRILLIALAIILVQPCRYWYLTKMYLQRAGYPFQFRLSQWDYAISNSDKKNIHQFLNQKQGGQHLVIIGGGGHMQTSLGVAIGTELSIQHNTCTYTTAMQLLSFFIHDNVYNETGMWGLHNCSTLIITDINPGAGIEQPVISPEMFLNIAASDKKQAFANYSILSKKNVVWVVGAAHLSTPTQCMTWIEMLTTMGVSQQNIISINLNSSNSYHQTAIPLFNKEAGYTVA